MGRVNPSLVRCFDLLGTMGLQTLLHLLLHLQLGSDAEECDFGD